MRWAVDGFRGFLAHSCRPLAESLSSRVKDPGPSYQGRENGPRTGMRSRLATLKNNKKLDEMGQETKSECPSCYVFTMRKLDSSLLQLPNSGSLRRLVATLAGPERIRGLVSCDLSRLWPFWLIPSSVAGAVLARTRLSSPWRGGCLGC